MKTNKLETESTKRNRYTQQFKEQALERAKWHGVPQVAKDLGVRISSVVYKFKIGLYVP